MDIIAEEGVGALSIRKIASRINVSSMTLYNYIENVEDIKKDMILEGFRILYKQGYEKLRQIKERDGIITLAKGCRALAEILYDFGAEHPSLFELIFCNSGGILRKDAEIAPFYGFFNLLHKRDNENNDYSRALRMLDFVAVYIILERVRGADNYTKQEYMAHIDEFISNMF